MYAGAAIFTAVELDDAEELSIVAWQSILVKDEFAFILLLVITFNLSLNYVFPELLRWCHWRYSNFTA